ncbi:MAG: aminodeoxychorismate/anthranilate synthase component II [Candidatus Dormibacteraeota bacterium]|nr:aminodeoxychorismate/anthranilate synthase component II [Candidatus Dormibacteraeota bacterium]MBV9526120.1 aminodeoxychorismate/anthranilate synthase component II [Candidatus Dormibacteraeota bacterium]
MKGRVLLIDNYDSFTYNLAQYLGELGADVDVLRNDARAAHEIAAAAPAAVVMSPGPKRPEDAGVCVDLVRLVGERTPILGVCLGMQAIGVAYGARVVRAPEVVHGKVRPVRHDSEGVLCGLANPFMATRYHSLVVEGASLPAALRATAWSEDGLVMAVRHRSHPVEGVQFHPESIGTPEGHRLLRNFLEAARVPLAATA